MQGFRRHEEPHVLCDVLHMVCSVPSRPSERTDAPRGGATPYGDRRHLFQGSSRASLWTPRRRGVPAPCGTTRWMACRPSPCPLSRASAGEAVDSPQSPAANQVKREELVTKVYMAWRLRREEVKDEFLALCNLRSRTPVQASRMQELAKALDAGEFAPRSAVPKKVEKGPILGIFMLEGVDDALAGRTDLCTVNAGEERFSGGWRSRMTRRVDPACPDDNFVIFVDTTEFHMDTSYDVPSPTGTQGAVRPPNAPIRIPTSGNCQFKGVGDMRGDVWSSAACSDVTRLFIRQRVRHRIRAGMTFTVELNFTVWTSPAPVTTCVRTSWAW